MSPIPSIHSFPIIATSPQTHLDGIDTISRLGHLSMTPTICDCLDPSPQISPSEDNLHLPFSVSPRSYRDLHALPYGYPGPHHSVVTLRNSEGVRLPIELWLDILQYLARDAMSLLCCALMHRGLHRPAQRMINKLRWPTIDTTRYDDLDDLVEMLRASSKTAMAIDRLYVAGAIPNSIPVVLSIIPIRLSSLLTSLRELKFENFTVGIQPYPSRWSLYGRAFPNLNKLELAYIRFPSLKDFVALITSFPVLNTLVLRYLTLGSPVIPICDVLVSLVPEALYAMASEVGEVGRHMSSWISSP
ncbi:hypothetical protein NLI96_g8737 [Meripilus lineatus]|uniref:F-box domain-containing protein n=1 Tax=Meripilus lineatus TaxID=2056292 RepID=A0AAD5YG06_9APHY|nr:hypothetical protein NLI96_g8737 [Physisporinus lineatus]